MSIDFLKTLLNYNSETGKFTWIKSNHPKQRVGKEAGTLVNGYVHITVHRKQYKAHRLAWAFSYGVWPAEDIDHINMNREDNRITNLRSVSRSVNQQNKILAHSNSSTQKLGAHKHGDKFSSQIRVNGTLYYLGTFDTSEEAHNVYLCAKRKLHEGNTL